MPTNDLSTISSSRATENLLLDIPTSLSNEASEKKIFAFLLFLTRYKEKKKVFWGTHAVLWLTSVLSPESSRLRWRVWQDSVWHDCWPVDFQLITEMCASNCWLTKSLMAMRGCSELSFLSLTLPLTHWITSVTLHTHRTHVRWT